MVLDKTAITLVDKNDRVLGFKEKLATHKIPVPLHRAISIVIFNKDKSEMLITKRSVKKPTWPLFWSNSVCSHPHPNESYQEAAERRVFEEVGFRTKLSEVFRFSYEAKYDETWGEHEYDVVFKGEYGGEVKINPAEASDFKWLAVEELYEDIDKNPQEYTPWLKMILENLK